MSEALRQRIAPLADAADDLARAIDSASVGQHATRGHAVLLRQIGAHLRSEAAVGRTAHEFGGNYYASADGALSPQVVATLHAAGVRPTGNITLAELATKFEAAQTEPSDRILIKQHLHRTGRLVA
jgi:hypothetical protein